MRLIFISVFLSRIQLPIQSYQVIDFKFVVSDGM